MFTLKIKTDNAAFEDEGANNEIARILRALAKRLEDGQDDRGLLNDLNGNHVGEWRLTR